MVKLNLTPPTLVANIYEGSNGSAPTELTVVNDAIFFVTDDGIHGTELWKSTGTKESTTLVRELGFEKLL